tara:strand:- start:457 stop:801 length:345 start_codon:yes stop_codon:yes gene_type:complete
MAKIYHNPRCSKSRQTLEILHKKGIKPEVIDYIKNTIQLSEINHLFEFLNLKTALPMIRTKEVEFKEAGLSKESSNEELLSALITYPKLLERPIVITNKGARICRPPELVNEIL